MLSVIIFFVVLLGFIALIQDSVSANKPTSSQRRKDNGNGDSSWYYGDVGGYDSGSSNNSGGGCDSGGFDGGGGGCDGSGY
ncbi:hypothetical protein [Brasilonema sp. UFV-L1]|uniref:hypothetical protein n=1 Tax=Brasilonema sp. UFV-L1 TaxID=2234130 RepID=UPI00145F2AF5|nr:hypothetical protein [Brasilonema sp. UFV-L1]NMG09718.1 hypothetical protein [Brasilonema sp. UFV-L1]